MISSGHVTAKTIFGMKFPVASSLFFTLISHEILSASLSQKTENMNHLLVRENLSSCIEMNKNMLRFS